jgi:hypothetical protein
MTDLDDCERHLATIRLPTDRPVRLCRCRARLCIPGREYCGICDPLASMPVPDDKKPTVGQQAG